MLGRRIVAGFLGLFYLGFLSAVFTQITQAPFPLVLFIVVAAATTIMICLGYFAVRLANRPQSMRQVDLSAMLLLAVPLAILLASIRLFLEELPTSEYDTQRYIFAGIGAIVYVGFTTLILMWLAEALLWLANLIVKLLRPPRP